jgi:site-specific DNA-cytosine methylase
VRILELFSGIGGLAEAARGRYEVVGAVDHDRRAQAVYAAHFPEHRREVKNLAAVKPAWLGAFGADLWWLSPPCTPHSVRGQRRDLDDPRSAALRNVLRAVREARPPALALENVPGFDGSDALAEVLEACAAAGLDHVVTREICPTLLGVPGVRRRFYLVASRSPVVPGPPPRHEVPLRDVLGPDHDALRVPDDVLARFGGALHVVEPDDDHAVAACFTRAYGNSPVYAGSYVRGANGVLRRFSPVEIARLHGHAHTHGLEALPLRDGWKLVGNGLSVPVVRWVVSWLAPAAAGDDQGAARGNGASTNSVR